MGSERHERLLNDAETAGKPLNRSALRGADKPRFVHVTNADEIAAIQRNLLDDPIGGQDASGQWWAYSWSLERYRAQLARAAGSPGGSPDAD